MKTWTPEMGAHLRAGLDAFVPVCLKEGFQYPLVCTLVFATGGVLVLKYAKGEPNPIALLEFNSGADFRFPAGLVIQDCHCHAGHFRLLDPEPVEALKRQLFPAPIESPPSPGIQRDVL